MLRSASLAVAGDIAEAGTAGAEVAVLGDFCTVTFGACDACAMTVEASYDGSTWYPVYAGDAPVPVSMAAFSGSAAIGPVVCGCFDFVRVKSSIAQAAGVDVSFRFFTAS